MRSKIQLEKDTPDIRGRISREAYLVLGQQTGQRRRLVSCDMPPPTRL